MAKEREDDFDELEKENTKKKNKVSIPWFHLVCTALPLVGIILMAVGLSKAGLSVIGIPGGIIFGALWVLITFVSFMQEKNKRYCKKCNYKYDYEEDVEWQIVSRREKRYKPREAGSSRHMLALMETWQLQVGCQCPECGKVHKYKTSLLGRRVYWDGSEDEKNPAETIAKEYSKGILGGAKEAAITIIFGLMCIGLGVFLMALPLLVDMDALANLNNLSEITSPDERAPITSNSENDPENYYGVYAAAGNGMTLEISEDGTYVMKSGSAQQGTLQTSTGNVYFKNKNEIGEYFSNLSYSTKDALVLSTEDEDVWIILWIMDNGANELEINKDGTTFERS